MTPDRNVVETTCNDAPDKLKTILISGIMGLSNDECREILSALKSKGVI